MQNMQGTMNSLYHTSSFTERLLPTGPRMTHAASVICLAFTLASCSQTTQPVSVSVALEKPSVEREIVHNLHAHTDDMDVLITKRTKVGDLSGLKIWRDNGMMKASFLITNNRSEPINLLSVESWTDQAGKPIDSRMDEQTVVVASSRTQTILISAPVPQARNAVIELVSGR